MSYRRHLCASRFGVVKNSSASGGHILGQQEKLWYLPRCVCYDDKNRFVFMSQIGVEWTIKKMKKVTIYTDGACLGNPGPGGYGVVLLYNGHRKEISGGFRLTTNNRMEIYAAIAGLSVLNCSCEVILYTDSRYLADAMNKGWVKRWKAKGWMRNKKEKALNVDLWEKLLELCDRHVVKFVWIRGHDGNPENERCDELSTLAARQKDLPIDEGYERTLNFHE